MRASSVAGDQLSPATHERTSHRGTSCGTSDRDPGPGPRRTLACMTTAAAARTSAPRRRRSAVGLAVALSIAALRDGCSWLEATAEAAAARVS